MYHYQFYLKSHCPYDYEPYLMSGVKETDCLNTNTQRLIAYRHYIVNDYVVTTGHPSMKYLKSNWVMTGVKSYLNISP
jgi:hypothetical protein